MSLSVQDFATMVKTQAVAVTASCQQLVDVSIGSVLRAVLEANASLGLWVQWLILQVLATTRAATSTGPDLDTWVADFGMARLPASSAAGLGRFSRASPGLAATVPIGALVRTGTTVADQVFTVVSDPTNPAWIGAGFQIGASETSITVPLQALSPGSAGNVRAGSITQLASAMPGIDTITNDAPMLGGLDAENDDALRRRFSGFLDSRSRGTEQAVGFAIASVQQGLSFTIAERTDASGAPRAGHFTVTVDDGTGAPSSALIASVTTAVEQVRPVGGTFSVRPPLVIPVDVVVSAVGSPLAFASAQLAVLAYVSTLPIGAALVRSKIVQIAHESSAGLSSITTVSINGAPEDFLPPIYGLVRPHSVVVTP